MVRVLNTVVWLVNNIQLKLQLFNLNYQTSYLKSFISIHHLINTLNAFNLACINLPNFFHIHEYLISRITNIFEFRANLILLEGNQNLTSLVTLLRKSFFLQQYQYQRPRRKMG